MGLLKKENWIVCCLLLFLSQGLLGPILAYFMKLYDKKAWYGDYKYWLIGFLCCFFPFFIMLYVLLIQMNCTVAKNLNVPGKEIYASPYSWILCAIVPIIGWILMIVMYFYVEIWTIVMLKRGEGEKFIS